MKLSLLNHSPPFNPAQFNGSLLAELMKGGGGSIVDGRDFCGYLTCRRTLAVSSGKVIISAMHPPSPALASFTATVGLISVGGRPTMIGSWAQIDGKLANQELRWMNSMMNNLG